MKQKNEVTDRVAEIYRRFFQAIQLDSRTNLKKFCRTHDLNYRKFIELKSKYYNLEDKDTRYTVVPLDAILMLCDDLSLSIDWILSGRGEMYINNNVK